MGHLPCLRFKGSQHILACQKVPDKFRLVFNRIIVTRNILGIDWQQGSRYLHIPVYLASVVPVICSVQAIPSICVFFSFVLFMVHWALSQSWCYCAFRESILLDIWMIFLKDYSAPISTSWSLNWVATTAWKYLGLVLDMVQVFLPQECVLTLHACLNPTLYETSTCPILHDTGANSGFLRGGDVYPVLMQVSAANMVWDTNFYRRRYLAEGSGIQFGYSLSETSSFTGIVLRLGCWPYRTTLFGHQSHLGDWIAVLLALQKPTLKPIFGYFPLANLLRQIFSLWERQVWELAGYPIMNPSLFFIKSGWFWGLVHPFSPGWVLPSTLIRTLSCLLFAQLQSIQQRFLAAVCMVLLGYRFHPSLRLFVCSHCQCSQEMSYILFYHF